MVATLTQDLRIHDPMPSRPAESEERQLLERIATQDAAAFRALYLVYHKRMSRFLMRFVRHHEHVEEIINDTMYVVWCKAHAFRGESQVSTWILSIARFKALSSLRRRREVELDETVIQTVEGHALFRRAAVDAEDLAVLHQADGAVGQHASER